MLRSVLALRHTRAPSVLPSNQAVRAEKGILVQQQRAAYQKANATATAHGRKSDSARTQQRQRADATVATHRYHRNNTRSPQCTPSLKHVDTTAKGRRHSSSTATVSEHHNDRQPTPQRTPTNAVATVTGSQGDQHFKRT